MGSTLLLFPLSCRDPNLEEISMAQGSSHEMQNSNSNAQYSLEINLKKQKKIHHQVRLTHLLFVVLRPNLWSQLTGPDDLLLIQAQKAASSSQYPKQLMFRKTSSSEICNGLNILRQQSFITFWIKKGPPISRPMF